VSAVGGGVGCGRESSSSLYELHDAGLESRNGRRKSGFDSTRLGSGSGVESVAVLCAPVKGCICLVL
jgi:hypothetical protein